MAWFDLRLTTALAVATGAAHDQVISGR